MEQRPSVYVMMSSYNGERFIEEQIDSILAQQGEFDLFLHVRDDHSTDQTKKILESYAKKYSNITWEAGDNLGATLSFMQLIYGAGEFDYYAFSDQDDVWLPEKIQTALDFLCVETKPALYSCMKSIVDSHLNPLMQKDTVPKPGLLNAFFRSNAVSGCSMVYNRDFHKIISQIEFDWQKGFHDGWAYKLAEVFGVNIFDMTPHILYRQHGRNVSGAKAQGLHLFREKVGRLKTFHPDEYRTPSTYARYIVNQEDVPIPPKYYDILTKISMKNHTLRDGVFILRYQSLSKTPLYEYIWIVYRLLMGWY
jgi:glycosyltransferase